MPKPMATLPYGELEFAHEWVSSGEESGNAAYVRRSDGKVFIAGDAIDEDEIEPLPDDAEDTDRYAAVPHRRELGLGNAVARRFAAELAPQLSDAVDDVFRRRGAWRAFRNLLDARGLSDAWHAFEERETRAALIEWARDEGFEVPDESNVRAASADAQGDADDTGRDAQEPQTLSPHGATAGLFIYAKDLARLSSFYENVLGLARVHDASDLVVLRSPDLELLLHAIPPAIAAQIVIDTPPERREEAALKFFFTVPSFAAAGTIAAHHGGELLADEWHGPGFRVRNAVDPEGNIFQLREAAQ